MPATRSPRSASSFSSNSFDSYRRLESIKSPNFTFNDYVKLFDDDDAFYALQVALFERQDLSVKTHEIKHLNSLIQWLQDEINRQQEYVDEIFDGMEAAGLHQILKKHFVHDNGVIRTRRRVEFNIPQTTKKYSLYRRRSTPYPPPTTSLHDSSDDSLPTGTYQTISRYPLDGGFIHHYICQTQNLLLQTSNSNNNLCPPCRRIEWCQRWRLTGWLIKEDLGLDLIQ